METRIFGRDLITQDVLRTVKKFRSKELFFDWLHQNYEAIRCFHGCRPIAVEDYYNNGFLPSDFNRAKSDFSDFLTRVNYTRDYNIDHVIKSYSGSIDKLIYFILNEEDFLHSAPHYIIYGSELMLSLAQNVNESLKYFLRNIGTPTIFQCDIPLSMISEDELTPIYQRVIDAKGSYNQKLNEIFSNYSIVVCSKLDSKYISSHKHPTDVIYDYHANEQYQNTLATCSICNRA